MVENMKTTKTRDEGVRKDGSVYMSRFADFEYPEIKRKNKERKGCIISNCRKESPSYNSS